MRKLALIIALLCVPLASAQVAVTPSPVAHYQFITVVGGGATATGTPLANGCVFTYTTLTTTPIATYTDYTGGTPNANPIILDGQGAADIWLDNTKTYRFKVVSGPSAGSCSAGVTQWQRDGISTPTVNSILASNNVFTGSNTFNGNTTVTTLIGPTTVSGNNTHSGTETFNGTPAINLKATAPDTANLYGFNLAYPTFTNTPPNGSSTVHQFDQFCAPDTDGFRGCGWVLNKFLNSADLTNAFFQSPYHIGLNLYNAGLSSTITSISRAANVVTVNTTSQVSLRPTIGDVNIAGVTGCATSPNGHFNPATVVSATQFTYAQTGPNETCTPSTGTASPAGRTTFFMTRNDVNNATIQTWYFQGDCNGDRGDVVCLLQMPSAGNTGNVGGFARWQFTPATTAGVGVGTTEQGFLQGNTTSYGLFRANSQTNDNVGNIAAFSLRNSASTKETFINGVGSNGNGTWDVAFNSVRGCTSNCFWRFLMDGTGQVFVNSSDAAAPIPANFINGLQANSIPVVTTTATQTVSGKTMSNMKVGLGALSAIQDSTGATSMGLTLKKGSGAGNYTNATTAYTVADSTNLCFTVTIPTGWKLGVSVSGGLSTATAAVVAQAALTDNAACSTANAGILVESPPIQGAGIGVADTFALNWVITGDGAAHNVALQFKTSNVADTASLINSSATSLPTMKFELMPSN